MIRWLVENRQWVFSGIGVVVLGGAVAFIRRRMRSGPQRPNENATAHLRDVQAGRDINISLASGLEPHAASEDTDEELMRSMTALMTEMRSDLTGPDGQFVREFFVLRNHRVVLGGSEKPRFIYYEDDHPNLRNQLDLLEERGLVRDVTPIGNNIPIYRITEKLVMRLVKNKVTGG